MNSKQILSRLTVAILGLGFALGASAGNLGLSTQQVFGAGSNPWRAISTDLNGDGMPDLVVANWTDGTVSVLMNTAAPGDSSARYATQQTFPVGAGPTYIVAADVNGDGKPDLIVTNSMDKTVSVLINTTPTGSATPSFAPQLVYPVGTYAESVAVADINGDGLPDLVVANYGDYTLSVLVNTTTGSTVSFADQQVIPAIGGPFCVRVVDLNGDGSPDVVVTEYDTNAVSVLLNTTPAGSSTVSFANQVDFPTGTLPNSLFITDLNGDGLLDIAVANEGDGTVSVLLNNTDPSTGIVSFASQQTFAVGNTPERIMAGDLDGDGLPDLVVANYSDNTVSVLINGTATDSSTASFAPQQTFAVGAQPISVVLGDENGDGKRDIVVANSGDNTVSVLLNTTP